MRIWHRARSRLLAFDAFGVQLEVAVSDAQLLEAVREILPPGWRPVEASEEVPQFTLDRVDEDGFDLKFGEIVVMKHATLDVALRMLDSQIQGSVAGKARDRIFVRAGVVVHDRQAVALLSDSLSGKTTLVRALVDAGATYFSDQYAVLDAQGQVHPYPRPLSPAGGYSILSEDQSANGRHTAQEQSAPLHLVVVTRYRRGAEWRPKRLAETRGALAMLAHAVPAQERPRESMRAVSHAVRGAVVLEGDRGEAAPAAAAILEALTDE